MQNIVVNLQAAAVTEYKDFRFLTVYSENGKTYGVKEDGVYEISYDLHTDNSVAINPHVVTGFLTLDNYHKKRVSAVYFDQVEDPNVPVTAIIRYDNLPDLKYAHATKTAPGKGAVGYSVGFGAEAPLPFTLFAITYILTPLRRRGG